jgi:hypothetical protein
MIFEKKINTNFLKYLEVITSRASSLRINSFHNVYFFFFLHISEMTGFRLGTDIKASNIMKFYKIRT